MNTNLSTPVIDEQIIEQIIARSANPAKADRRGSGKGGGGQGALPGEIATLMAIDDADHLDRLFTAAKAVKEHIYGRRLVFFAPLYVSNLCRNECAYCAFRAKNRLITRKALSQEEIRREVEFLVNQGHKRILLVAFPGNRVGRSTSFEPGER